MTSVLIGPRTPQQLTDLLAGGEAELTADILDRIDEVVPPGAKVRQDDSYYTNPGAGRRARLSRAHLSLAPAVDLRSA
jgi:hypothetical protein